MCRKRISNELFSNQDHTSNGRNNIEDREHPEQNVSEKIIENGENKKELSWTTYFAVKKTVLRIGLLFFLKLPQIGSSLRFLLSTELWSVILIQVGRAFTSDSVMSLCYIIIAD